MIVGADTGGTFTDFALLADGSARTWKTPSTPDDYARAVLDGLEHLLGGTDRDGRPADLVHASTVATNALLERKGGPTALVTTAGFGDVLAIGRQARPSLYDLARRPTEPLVPAAARLEVAERVAADGEVLVGLEPAAIGEVLDRVEGSGARSLAVCLLFSFLHPDHERAIGEAGRARGLAVSLSSEIAPEFREYERTSTTVVDAYVGPVVAGYLDRLGADVGRLGIARMRVVRSNGGSLPPAAAARRPVETLVSGPAAGAMGALAAVSEAIGDPPGALSFDMGGTSTDVALLEGELPTTTEARVGGHPVAIPMVDLHTVGAGGGSIARIDAGGALAVGPESAGADPGPACYGVGDDPTVTDANVVLGRIDPERFLDGRLPIDPDRSARALEPLARATGVGLNEAARAVLAVVDAGMVRALKVISVERGYDPAGAVLVAFGGSGGLHACSVAEALGTGRILVPRDPGVLSALGAAGSAVVGERSRTVMRALDAALGPDLDRTFDALEEDAARDLAAGDGSPPDRVATTRATDLRYRGQSYELTVPYAGDPDRLAADFHAAHERRFGHAAPGEPIEVVTLRVRALAAVEIPPPPTLSEGTAEEAMVGETGGAAVYDRAGLGSGARFDGPALVVEPYATTWLARGWTARVDARGHLHLVRDGQ